MESGTIKKISVEKLFGQFDYVLPDEGSLTNPAILYGDNGVGKSTLLALVFHLLSSAGDRGHRTAIWNISFLSLYVELKNGFVLSAERPQGLDSSVIVFQVRRNHEVQAEWTYSKGKSSRNYVIDDDVSDIVLEQLLNSKFITPNIVSELRTKRSESIEDGVLRGEAAYLKALKDCSPTIFLVSAERRLDSDSVSDPAEEMELREILHDRRGSKVRDLVKGSRQIALKQALMKASAWVQNRALRSATQGSMNVHSVYEQVLGQLAVDYPSENNDTQHNKIETLLNRLDTIENNSQSYSAYEMTGAMDMTRFREALTSGPEQGRSISARLVDPYVRSVLSRLDAISPVFKSLDLFINQINSFLTRKKMCFSMSKGFSIENSAGDELEAYQLSSGEQQLLLMFCYAFTAQDQPSVFIVDEPEISLNIKWQRKLLQALSKITHGTETQFIFASHSLELIAQHRSSVVEIS
ncbi:AAA family ATPase [Shimia sagamensis]|uniref:AAA domain-containing protein, putative AbiEii toxin, Type IV TA system n=1 Tax=Shimia sagamensis TaxID=1566352 RepID=A0ABY1PMC8_9RHOB|nr:AAA family ATPase [Shimia sagamensis]SMP36510.1 AAA domain-containing protein, putative AbiEii toxin, Type IV TA system [Shimia sagamensis]